MFRNFYVMRRNASSSRCRRSLQAKTLALLTLLVFLPNVFSQSSVISNAMAPMALYINILEGEDALNNIHDRTAREPIVQVTDENHKPVKGAYVTFTEVAGATGAGATFGGLLTYTAVTDADGKAVGRGFKPNSITGDHRVQVAAALGALLAALIYIHEKNVNEGGGAGPARAKSAAGAGTSAWFIGEFAAAATGVGLYLGLHGNGEGPGALDGSGTIVPGTPASVPEIDSSMAFGCLALLAGAVAVLRGRQG